MPFKQIQKIFSFGSPQSEALERTTKYDATQGADMPDQILEGYQANLDKPAPAAPVDNVQYGYEWLTGDGIKDYTGGAIQPLTPEAASGLLGNWVTETGDPTLTALDIVEDDGKGKGRGISQYTAARRGPYDQWRQDILDAGGDPNTMQNQLEYFADEYLGKYDPAPGKSLVGYTNSLSELGGMDAAGAARHLRRDFFRPSKAHEDRRVDAAINIYDRFNP